MPPAFTVPKSRLLGEITRQLGASVAVSCTLPCGRIGSERLKATAPVTLVGLAGNMPCGQARVMTVMHSCGASSRSAMLPAGSEKMLSEPASRSRLVTRQMSPVAVTGARLQTWNERSLLFGGVTTPYASESGVTE